jgi:hypothetical protein
MANNKVAKNNANNLFPKLIMGISFVFCTKIILKIYNINNINEKALPDLGREKEEEEDYADDPGSVSARKS